MYKYQSQTHNMALIEKCDCMHNTGLFLCVLVFDMSLVIIVTTRFLVNDVSTPIN